MNAPGPTQHLLDIERHATVAYYLEPLCALLDAPDVTEIAINRPGEVWVERGSRWTVEYMPAITTQWMQLLSNAVAVYSQQKISPETPMLGATLPDGSRVQFVGPPAVEADRWSMTLRKPSPRIITLDEFAERGFFAKVRPYKAGLTEDDKALIALLETGDFEAFCRRAVLARKNIVVCGATGSGKTTFMKGLVNEIPLHERLISIEDVRELFVPHRNVVHLLYSKGGQSLAKGITAQTLMEGCLRMKPDRILVAELRGAECLYYVRSAASGHPGSITSCHAGSPALAFEQLAIMIQDSQGGANLNFDTIKRLLTLTIDVVIHVQNSAGDRYISEIYFDPQRQVEAAK